MSSDVTEFILVLLALSFSGFGLAGIVFLLQQAIKNGKKE